MRHGKWRVLTVWVTGALLVNVLTIVVVLVKTVNGIVVIVVTTYKVSEGTFHNSYHSFEASNSHLK
jgi:hypothetical protein